MPQPEFEGRTVALMSCPAYDNEAGVWTQIGGLYDVEEQEYDHGEGYCILVRHGENPFLSMGEVDSWNVATDVLWEQVDPKGFGRRLAEDRFFQLASEEGLC